jgi:hypothetical protein
MAPWFGLGRGKLKEEGGYINYHEDIELAGLHAFYAMVRVWARDKWFG